MVKIPDSCQILIISHDEVYDVGKIESFLINQSGITHKLLLNLDDLVEKNSNKDLGVIIYIDRYAEGVSLRKVNNSFRRVKNFLKGIPALKFKKVIQPKNEHLVEQPKEEFILTIRNAPKDGKIKEVIDFLKNQLSAIYPFTYKTI